MSSLDSFSSANHEPGTSQSHAEKPTPRPTGLKLILPPLKAGKPIKGSKRPGTGNGASFTQEPEAKKAPRPVKLKPLKEVLTRLISQIKKKDDYAFFLTPVNVSSVPGYLDAVKRPMDFGTMTTKVNKGKYRSLEEFASDFRLVTTNAKIFNPPGTIYHTEADRIELFGLDHISKAAATVIEYETDWNIEIEQDDENTTLNIDEYDGDAPTPMDVDESLAAASPAPSASQSLPAKRGTRGPYKKATAPSIAESIDAEGRLPGSKDGLAAFPPGSDWAKLMLALKLKGKRYRTKKERLRMEKGGPPYCADGSLDYSEMEDPFSILSIFVPDPPSRPQLFPLYPSQPPSNPIDLPFPAPTNIPEPSYPPPPQLKTHADPPKRRHWLLTRNPLSRANRVKEKDDEDFTPAWQVPREAHAVDFGPYPGLVTELAEQMGISDIGAQLGTEEAVFDAIRESVQSGSGGDEVMEVDQSSHDEYWTGDRGAAAQDYIRDVVYGGVDGLAYIRSLAEFVTPPATLVKDEPIDSSRTGLGMPLAQYVENFIVDPITEGLHNVLRTTAQHLIAPTSTTPLSTSIASQIDISLHTYPPLAHTLSELKKVTSETIDMAALIRLPAELFLSEHEWAGARWKEEAAKKAEEDKARSMGLWQVDGQGASEYLAFAIKSHQEAQAHDGTSGYVKEEPEMLQYVMDHAAKAIVALDARRQAGDLKLKPPLDDKSNSEDGTQAVEDTGLRELRLNLLALAKRAPLDKIQRLPVDLIPEHIRHFVPTL